MTSLFFLGGFHMEEVKFVNAFFKPYTRIVCQGSHKKIRHYLDAGFSLTINNCGYNVLTKPAELIVF